MSTAIPATIRLSLTDEVRNALRIAKKHYPALSDPEILKLGLSKIVTEDRGYSEFATEREEIRRGASFSLGEEYLSNPAEDVYIPSMGKKVHFR